VHQRCQHPIAKSALGPAQDAPPRGLLDYLIRPQQERRRDRQAEGLGGLEVDNHVVAGGLLDREVGALGALQDLINEGSNPAP